MKKTSLSGRILAALGRALSRIFNVGIPLKFVLIALLLCTGGAMFITPGTKVYAGMVVGVCPKSDDVSVNVCRTKHLTNTRASGSDEALRLIPARQMSLEQCLEFLADDELLEVTPKNLRLRKRILDHSQRMKAVMRNK